MSTSPSSDAVAARAAIAALVGPGGTQIPGAGPHAVAGEGKGTAGTTGPQDIQRGRALPMKTLEISDYDTGDVLDRVHLSPDGQLTYDTGAAQTLFETLVAQGMQPSQAFEARTGWSNGYLVSNLEK